MKIEKFPLGILGANCYLLINEETKDTVVVDPGGHSKKFTAYIEEEKLNLVAILLTHGHFDHIMGIDSILENWNIPVYVEEEDLPIMTDPELNLSSSYTNGYSFHGAKPLKVFSGDTLFQRSVGRTDFPNSSQDAIVRSVRERLFALPDDTIVYPGHMGETKIEYEKLHNPYVQEG